MAYCTLEQLTDRYGSELLRQVSDRGETPANQPDAALFARAIADASALIDGYLAGRYSLPLSPVPDLLVDLGQRVTIYMAHGSVAGEKIRKDYDDALKTLQQIAGGTIRLTAAGAEPAAPGSGGVVATATSKPLSVDSLKGYV